MPYRFSVILPMYSTTSLYRTAFEVSLSPKNGGTDFSAIYILKPLLPPHKAYEEGTSVLRLNFLYLPKLAGFLYVGVHLANITGIDLAVTVHISTGKFISGQS